MDQSILNKARKDKFVLVMNLPKALRNIDKKDVVDKNFIDFDSLQFSIYGNITPEVTVPSIGLGYSGQEIKLSSHSRNPYGNIYVNFDVDNQYKNWWVIYKWLNYLNNEKYSHFNYENYSSEESHEALKDYSTNWTTFALDEYNNPVMKFEFTGCFPVSLGKIEFDERDDSIIKSSLEFSFSFFSAEPV